MKPALYMALAFVGVNISCQSVSTSAWCHKGATVKCSETPPFFTYSRTEDDRVVLHLARKIGNVEADAGEWQTFVIEIQNPRACERIQIPSNRVACYFRIDRFGPHSLGKSFRGEVRIRDVTPDLVDASLSVSIEYTTFRQEKVHR